MGKWEVFRLPETVAEAAVTGGWTFPCKEVVKAEMVRHNAGVLVFLNTSLASMDVAQSLEGGEVVRSFAHGRWYSCKEVFDA